MGDPRRDQLGPEPMEGFEPVWVVPKMMVPSNHPFVHRDFHYFHHPFWGTSIFGNIRIAGVFWGHQNDARPFFGGKSDTK